MPDPIAQFADAKYLNLETFRKNGVGVRTPVWFAEDWGPPPEVTLAQEGLPEESPRSSDRREQQGIIFYIYSEANAGKVKRIRNNPKARIAPCNFRGKLRGAWVDARARICDEREIEHAQDLLRRKYGWLKITGDFFSRLRGGKQTLIAIDLG
ncbi:MAG: pyridoxamine 5'-phosphate oxidase family protein [Candidatus Korobacteraceae bacterium]